MAKIRNPDVARRIKDHHRLIAEQRKTETVMAYRQYAALVIKGMVAGKKTSESLARLVIIQLFQGERAKEMLNLNQNIYYLVLLEMAHAEILGKFERNGLLTPDNPNNLMNAVLKELSQRKIDIMADIIVPWIEEEPIDHRAPLHERILSALRQHYCPPPVTTESDPSLLP
jgi:hypothetical protein